MTDKAGVVHTARASFVRVKLLDAEERLIEGTATSPTTDRVGDIVLSTGAQFTLPLPLLLDHEHDKAVGEVIEAKATAKGIKFKAKIAKIEAPGAAKDLVDYAWDLVKSGLRKTVSIGFRPLPGGWEPMPGGGIMFSSWEWFELSLVAVPANPDARIDSYKAAGAARPRRRKASVVVQLSSPAEREVKRLNARLGEISKAKQKLQREKREAKDDRARVEVINSATDQLEGERKFYLERRVGIEGGLIEVTEREMRLPLVKPTEEQRKASQKPRRKMPVVHLRPPGEREIERIEARLKEIAKALKGIEREEYLHWDDKPRTDALDEARKALEKEHEFLVKRQVGIQTGLIVVTEKELAAPLAKSTQSAKLETTAVSHLSSAKARAWPEFEPLWKKSDGSIQRAVDHGRKTITDMLKESGFGPDAVIRASVVVDLAGPAMGMAKEAFSLIADLQRRMAELETAGIKYVGTWQRAMTYPRGSIVTSGGSAWVALKDVPEGEGPGQSPEHWQLMVKAGRDGRDADAKQERQHAPIKLG